MKKVTQKAIEGKTEKAKAIVADNTKVLTDNLKAEVDMKIVKILGEMNAIKDMTDTVVKFQEDENIDKAKVKRDIAKYAKTNIIDLAIENLK